MQLRSISTDPGVRPPLTHPSPENRSARLTGGLCAGLILAASLCPAPAEAARSQRQTKGRLEVVHRFYGPMPTGVTVSGRGRIFVNYPRWGDPVRHTVAELRGGREVAYPPDPRLHDRNLPQSQRLVSVQSVVVDPRDRLWILDTGSVKFAPTQYGGPKLIGVDLRTNKVFRKILFPQSVALPTTYLNDIRFDLRRGKAGMAFITDSSSSGPNGLIVVDLATGQSWRRLHDHPSTMPEPNFRPVVERQVVMVRKPGQPPKPLNLGSDGIAISADGERLYYCPLASRKLYSVSVDALADRRRSDDEVAETVLDHGIKGASDGLESDAANRVYVTDYEKNAVKVRLPNGRYRTVAQDPRMLWPDTLSVARNGYLYVTANQLHRQGQYHNGKDLRKKPYYLFRTRINARPIPLR